ncbi:uncharacterized protein EAF01_005961 [Botrytis porri]|uniref:Ubiquitin-like domain-containing protein n=1 Tax=Botrytis porri TaxID=87229 RepID=A0A4Z1L032_9HELO|nr:uncharacterized protein EAF01_005961 [Botrytis porri]KAF7905440.1 hypothetical protein EAF01_005961 [Botrytis porri]TGO90205.1 hypothetical protein BPOR_0074g00120 [Botrytis porri]
MAYNAFQSTVLLDGDEDDSNFVNQAYRPCKILYLMTSTGVHSLRNVGPNYRILLVKSRFVASLLKRGVIPHDGHDCALSYGGRELADDETLESCRVGDEATVNAVVWEQNPNLPGFSGHAIHSSLKIRHEYEQKTKQSKHSRVSLDLAEEGEYEDRVLWRAPASKKQKSLRFSDQDDAISHPPTSSRSSSPSQNPSPEHHIMSGALGPTDSPLEFHDSLVRDISPRGLQRRQPLGELSGSIMPQTPLRSPTFYSNSAREPETPIRASYDAFRNPITPRDASRRDLHRNYNLLRHSDRIPHRRMEYGSSSTVVRFYPKLQNGQSLTSHSFPAVRNNVYVRPPGSGPTSGSLPPSSLHGAVNPVHVITTLTPDPYQPLFPPTSPEIPSFKPKSPTRQNPSFKDRLASYVPLPSGSPSISNTFIHRYLLSQPSDSSSRSIPKSSPTSTSPHQSSNPYFLRSTPLSILQSLNSYFSTPSSSLQPFQSPSVLQALNPYFSNTSPPPPKYSLSQTLFHSPSVSPQPTNQDSMDYDYFQAARSKRSSSPPRLHPLKSPLPPPPPPPPQNNIESPSATIFPYGGQPSSNIPWDKPKFTSPSPKADYLQFIPSPKSALKSKLQPKAPEREPPPTPPTHPAPSPHYHIPLPSRPPSPNREEKQKQPQPSRIPSSYVYYPQPSKSFSDPLAASSLPTPDPTPPLPFTGPSKRTSSNHHATTTSKQSYYSSHSPPPTGSSLQGTIAVPSVAHEMLPKDFLAYRTVRQLIELQGWEMNQGEWRSIREVLKRCKRGENGARGNIEVLAKGVVELENSVEMS